MNESMSNMKAKEGLRFVGVVERAGEQEAKVRILPEFCAGLKAIADFSHIIILYWMHMRDSEEERQTLDVSPRKHAVNVEKGVFACRSPSRPNQIGLCVAQLLKVEECLLTVRELDALEGSPIIDIRPYLPRADLIPNARAPEWTLHGPPT